MPLQGSQWSPTLWRDTHTCGFIPYLSPLALSPCSSAPAFHCPSPCPLAGCGGGWGLQVGGWPTFVFQAAVGLIALVRAVVETVTDEAPVEAEPLVAQVLIPGTALCSAGRDGQAGNGIALGTLPCPSALGITGDPLALPAARRPGSARGGVLTLTGSYGAVAGTEAWGAHAAVRNEGDTQAVGVGVEGWGGHAATKPAGTTRGQCLPPEILPSPHRTATLPGCKEPYLAGPLRTGAGSVLLAPCSS